MQICLAEIRRVVDCERREDEMIITTPDPSIREICMQIRATLRQTVSLFKQVNSTCFVFPSFFLLFNQTQRRAKRCKQGRRIDLPPLLLSPEG